MEVPPDDLDQVLMKDYESHIRDQLGIEKRTVLYLVGSGNKSQAFFSFLVPVEKTGDYLQSYGWEHRPEEFGPSFSIGAEGTTYDRFGHNDGAEPILYVRRQRPEDVVELVEEFRLLFGLFLSGAGDVYRWTETGEKEVVGLVSSNKVEMDTRLVRRYLAVKRKCLVVAFDHRRSFDFETSAIPEGQRAREYKDARTYLNFWLTDMTMGMADDQGKTVAVIAGKRIIQPLPIEECGIWPYTGTAKRAYESFIIGHTESGEDLLHSCAPDGLADSFGRNPGEPHYLTQVCFRREVLSHYFNNTDKYSVGDGVVTCKGFWQLRMDNDGSEYVFAFLGDLGKIPNGEQLHWKRFNVSPTGEMSPTAQARSFDGEFADPTSTDLVLKHELSGFEEAWQEKHGWPLFQPFSKEDAHVLESLHIPAVSDQGNFDRQVLNLAKVLIDRLNFKELVKACKKEPENSGGINALQRYVEERQMLTVLEKLAVLRDVQNLRSSGAAHHKGEKWEAISKRLALTPDNLIESFETLLRRSIGLLSALKSTL